jgi:RHS repeat-associated protein
VLRVIRNCTYDAMLDDYAPDEQDAQGDWLYVPQHNGQFADSDLITSYELDALGRQATVADPVGSETGTVYAKDGQVVSRTDAAGHVTYHVYDDLRRLKRVIQNYVSNGEDPALWGWDATDDRWEESDGTPIVHGTDKDTNVIVDVALDMVGRRTALTDPRGNATTYSYDQLNRRTGLTNPLNKTWTTAYSDLAAGAGTRTTLTDPLGHATQRDSDRLGRLMNLEYLSESPKVTPDVTIGYDVAGNRVSMTEDDGSNTVRATQYSYDKAQRLTQVDFDTDGDSVVEQSVSYTYDAGGQRTTMTLPGDLTVTYRYDEKGQLVSLTDWDAQEVRYAYDQAGRLIATDRVGGFRSRYEYDAGGHLRLLRHSADGRLLGQFAYEVDALGNRVVAYETLPHPDSGLTVIASDDAAVDAYRGIWTTSGSLLESSNPSAALRVTFLGDEASLTLGVGPDYGICDMYIDGLLWRSFDNYAVSAGEDVIPIQLDGEGPHLIDIRNRSEYSAVSSGHKLAYKQLVVQHVYASHTIQYVYDGLSRLLSADYYAGEHVSGTPFQQYAYAFDLAGNRTLKDVDGTQTTYTYNEANQITNTGFAYDDAGRMTSDSTHTYTWDRANRLLSMGGIAYAYDGVGNRVSQTGNSIVTEYLNDVQPGLAKVLSEAVGGDVTRFVHGPRGIQAIEDSAGLWLHSVQDGLGSVRDGALCYSPFGDSDAVIAGFAFTGEMRDANGLQYHRARYYAPELGVWPSLDPVENGNRYAYVTGNPVTRVDPSGKCWKNPCVFYTYQEQCFAAWRGYADVIYAHYFNHMPRDVGEAVALERQYWANLSYEEFVDQWNNPNYPPSLSLENDLQSIGEKAVPAGFVVANFDTIAPGPLDIPGAVIVALGLCAIGLGAALAAQSGTITLPRRQPYYFSDTNERVDEDDTDWAPPWPNRDNRSCAESYPGMETCYDLVGRGGFSHRYRGYQDAATEIESFYRIRLPQNLEQDGWMSTDDDMCIGGKHWNIRGGQSNDFLATITCCPCCNDGPYGPSPNEERCWINWN